jgi:hypothetical protein
MPKEVLEEDKTIQVFPLTVKAEKVRIAPALDFFQKAGLPKTE